MREPAGKKDAAAAPRGADDFSSRRESRIELAWLRRDPVRLRVALALRQPMTAAQLAPLVDLEVEQAGHRLRSLARRGLARCLTPEAAFGRLYWLMPRGLACRRALLPDEPEPSFPIIDWSLYAKVCHAHRSAVLFALSQPLRPSEARRAIRRLFPEAKIGHYHVRDAFRLFRAWELIRPVPRLRGRWPAYELTAEGEKARTLLLGARRRLPKASDEAAQSE